MAQSTLSVSPSGPPSRTTLTLLALLFGCLLACGKLKEKITELTVEKATEAAGSEVDVSLSKVPVDWPAFLAPYPGAKIEVAGTSRMTGHLSGSLSMYTSDTPEQVLAHYTKSLSGFTLKQEVNMNGALTRTFTKDLQMATIHVTSANGRTQANVIIANF